jgi:hypothetical protein
MIHVAVPINMMMIAGGTSFPRRTGKLLMMFTAKSVLATYLVEMEVDSIRKTVRHISNLLSL